MKVQGSTREEFTPRSRWLQFVIGTASGALVLTAVPAVLVAAVGWPVPRGLTPHASSARLALDLVAIAAWATWAVCCVQLARAVAARIRLGDLTIDLTSPLTDRLAARMAAAILVAGSALTINAQGAGAVQYGSRRTLASGIAQAQRNGKTQVSTLGIDTASATLEPYGSAAAGAGVLVLAVLARRLRKRRQLCALGRPQRPLGSESPGFESTEANGPRFDTAALFGRFEDRGIVSEVEYALRQLPAKEGEQPGVCFLCVGPDGISALWRSPAPSLRPPWTCDVGGTWRLTPNGTELEMDSPIPAFPIVLPIGENDRGIWLTALQAGSCVSVLGPSAQPLVNTMRLVVEGWDWSEHVLVTDDPRVAEDLTHSTSADEHSSILFIGDPSRLNPLTLEKVFVVTTTATDAAQLTLLADRWGVTVHPFGLSLCPNILEADQTRDFEALLSTDASSEPLPTHAESIVQTAFADTSLPKVSRVTVRLLTPMPRIDGLAEELPPKRARRAIELVAYLALHRPHPVTTDRLRTRVLGSADLDAAAKTLFNTAAAARRALGIDSGGVPFLPVAGRSGQYRLSDDIAIDVLQVEQLVRRAGREADTVVRLDTLRRALSLVESEPMAAVSGGYAWWQTEGHAGRVSGLIVDAACHLADLATSSGNPSLASWAISQARLVEPYSEALSRAAMRAAAGAGDGDRLRREWHECCRQVDELDPGGMPSVETEMLYGKLVRRSAMQGVQASFPAIDPAPRSTVPSAPAAL